MMPNCKKAATRLKAGTIVVPKDGGKDSPFYLILDNQLSQMINKGYGMGYLDPMTRISLDLGSSSTAEQDWTNEAFRRATKDEIIAYAHMHG